MGKRLDTSKKTETAKRAILYGQRYSTGMSRLINEPSKSINAIRNGYICDVFNIKPLDDFEEIEPIIGKVS